MERRYEVRKQMQTVEELDGVVIVPPDRSRAGAPGTLRAARPPDNTGVDVQSRLAAEAARSARVFVDAGWTFIAAPPPPPAAPTPAAARAEMRAGLGGAWGRVYLHENGQLTVATGHVVLRLNEDLPPAAVQALFTRHRLRRVSTLRFRRNLFVVAGPPEVHVFDVAAALNGDRQVAYAEPNMIEHVPTREADPHIGRQWQWINTEAAGAWAAGAEGQDTVVAIIDHGFHLTVVDLAPAVVDSAGFFEAFAEDDVAFTLTRTAMPLDSHGTKCAGMAVARRDNGSAGCGMAHKAGLLPIACTEGELGSQVMLARAIAYAADPGTEGHRTLSPASVISCSLGPPRRLMFSVMEDALRFAFERGRDGLGVPVFWAVSNESISLEDDQVASSPLTAAVGRSDATDRRAPCAFGTDRAPLAFLAPGDGVFTVLSDNSVAVAFGTSFAAPCAAGVAALMLSVKPTLTAREVVEILKETCDPPVTAPPRLPDSEYGFGRINARRAVERAMR